MTTADLYVVCGSRDWPAPWFVTCKMIELIPHGSVVVTGGPRGVGRYADREAARLGYQRLVVRADWKAEGRVRARHIRNVRMLELSPVAVLAFQWNRSQGTGHIVREAHRRGITLHWFTNESLKPDISALDADYEPISPGGA